MAKIIKVAFWEIIFLLFLSAPVLGILEPIFELDSQNSQNIPLLAGDIIKQTFVSPANEFGAIGIKVDNNNQINDDFWTFRIKEKGRESWLFETKKYISDFQSKTFYPIGFPKIENALAKTFVFEIESEKGNLKNCASVFLLPENPPSGKELFLNNEKMGGTLAFALYKETPAQKIIFADFRKKINQDPLFFLFWLALAFSLASAIVKIAAYEIKGKH